MTKRHRLGQHLLKNEEILDKIVQAAQISRNDIVFEIGAGEGDLTFRLCGNASTVISTEIDRLMIKRAAAKLKECRNLELIHIDGFSLEKNFDILVSNIPYSKSGRFIEWLVGRKFKRAVVTVQNEFADKILAGPGSHNYRYVSVVAQAIYKIHKLFEVKNEEFDPPPKVNSTVLLFRPRKMVRPNNQTFSSLKTLFSFKGRRISAALRTMFKNDEANLKLLKVIYKEDLFQRRVEDLTPDEALKLANRLIRFKE